MPEHWCNEHGVPFQQGDTRYGHPHGETWWCIERADGQVMFDDRLESAEREHGRWWLSLIIVVGFLVFITLVELLIGISTNPWNS